jgi:hypothetical protein
MSNIESSKKESASERVAAIAVGVIVIALSLVAALAVVSYGFSGYRPGAAECFSGYPHLMPASCDFPINFVIAAGFIFVGGCKLAAYLWARP